MSKRLNLTTSMATAVRSSLIALRFEQADIQIAFDPMEVFVTESGWITVRGGPEGHEEHKDLRDFELAYKLENPDRELLSVANEMEAMCDSFLINAHEEGKPAIAAIWAERRDRVRAAIAAAAARASRQ